MRLNLLSEEKSVSASSLLHVLITRSQKRCMYSAWSVTIYDVLGGCGSGKGEAAAA